MTEEHMNRIEQVRELQAKLVKVAVLLESIKRYAADLGNKDLVINGDACEALDIIHGTRNPDACPAEDK